LFIRTCGPGRLKEEFDILTRLLRNARIGKSKDGIAEVIGEMKREKRRFYGEHSRQQDSGAHLAATVLMAAEGGVCEK
jgi:hypothetical protein